MSGKWHMRTRAALGLPLDRVVTADDQGRRAEIVEPAWYDVRRLLVWLLRTDGRVEFVVHGPDGNPIHVRRRTRSLPLPAPQGIVVDGRSIVPRPVAAEVLLRRGRDPEHRTVPDEVLERNFVTKREYWN